ncbi:hypothetical protein SISNIDRAFT_490417 [Sistotremastrum niveocremeum HHB9708]|uniref:Uncharacterized protein n=2 Tax=Sistotremastraceae TaxID=3402574 RepID=A0A164NUV0_9AGAM|nr:hypothetical protein SISNIDRAFT_490417 [Sistotremastrum niveocremeum HHB9708]KZT40512.1 hypothetical protein SISSUDRAFT_1031920 [Sistotremastrum suecicum HHB10207 ss-3]
MYSYNSPYSSPPSSSQISNNPFLQPDPGSDPDPRTKWPDISSPPINHQPDPQPYFQQQSSFQQPQPSWNFQPPSSPTWNTPQSNPYVNPQPTGFQPTSSFGQQLQNQFTGYPSSFPSPHSAYPSQPQQSGYQPDLSQFDPLLGPSSQSQHSQPQNTYSSSPSYTGSSNTGIASSGGGGGGRGPHPREYVRAHKKELEQWDPYTWKQSLNCFESLKSAWEDRARVLRSSISPYMQPQQTYQTTQMIRDAEAYIDSILASKAQMQEVYDGYKLSTDLASKNRVREGMNAGLMELPDWPQ